MAANSSTGGGDAGNQGMEKLIKIVNQLQDAFSSSGLPFGLELPQIVVVGGQSAGKSSVLENIVGKDFLPRGAGIVTRRPLVLQLIHAEREYAEFLHCPGRPFTNFDEVRKEIEAETDRETGSKMGIYRNPINLKVYSPNVLDLTLVDLPGMTRVPVGDQPPDIEVQIREMVLEFVRKENSLILAVSPANSDLANSDAMRVAKDVDPSGNRTIGVITKLDLMDQGTDARIILINQLLPLKRGYIGVVNRSQKDIEGKKDITAAMRAERQFFEAHPSYRDLCDKMGTMYLQQVLNKELGRHIQKTLPAIRNSLHTRMLQITKELSDLKDVSSPNQAKTELVRVMKEFAEYIETQIQGLNAEIDTGSLGAGAKINRIFYNEFAYNFLLEQRSDLMKREIAMAIRNIHGVRNGIFTPYMAFEATVVKIILRFRDPMKKCVQDVAKVLEFLIEQGADKTLNNYPKLKEEILFLIRAHIQEQESVSEKQLIQHVDAETAFLNTRHEDFVGTKGYEVQHADTPEFTHSLSSVRRKIEVQAKAIQKGWLSWKAKRIGAKDYWFILTADSLTAFTADTEQDVVFCLHLNAKVKLKPDTAKSRLKIYNIDSKDIIHGHPKLKIYCEDAEDTELWVSCFATAGVHPEEPATANATGRVRMRSGSDTSMASTEGGGEAVMRRVNNDLVRKNRATLRGFTKSMADPDMDKEIELIKKMVKSYLKIVGKTIGDITPKYIMLLLVLHTQKFITAELMSTILIENEPMTLMQGDAEQVNRREELEKAYKTAERALQIISEAQF